MTKRRISSMAELNSAINKMLVETLNKENNAVARVVKDIQSDMVEQEVYDKYDSDSTSEYRYVRRGDVGGLADTDNMIHDAAEINGKVKMIVLNLTEGQPNHKGDNLKTGQLAHLVEGGDGAHGLRYSYGNGSEEYMKKRPFQKETVKELQGNLQHVYALKHELKKKGFSIK